MLQSAIDGIRHDLHDFISTPGRRAFAFTITGRHAGALLGARRQPLTSDLDDPGQRASTCSLIDEATQQVTAIWAVADWLGLLLKLGAIGNDTQPSVPPDQPRGVGSVFKSGWSSRTRRSREDESVIDLEHARRERESAAASPDGGFLTADVAAQPEP